MKKFVNYCQRIRSAEFTQSTHWCKSQRRELLGILLLPAVIDDDVRMFQRKGE